MSKKNFKLGERVFVDNSGVSGMAGNGWGGSEGVVTHEPNVRGHVRVRLDKVPVQLKAVHDELDGLWCHVSHVSRVKRVERKFEIGDRVFVAHKGIKYAPDAWNGSYGTVTGNFIPKMNSVLVRLDDVPYNLRDMHEGMGGLWCDVENVFNVFILEREKPKNEAACQCEIRMSFVGNATTASLVDRYGNVKCSATARCHPDDKFSVAEGMTIAFDRLHQKYQKQNPNRATIMLGDKVRVINGAPLPLITNYGNTDKPSEIVLNEAGTVTSLSPNSENAIVEWRENVVAVAATAGLEIVREPKAKPKYRKGDILVTRKNGCYMRVTKDYYDSEEKVLIETAHEVAGELTPDKFAGKLDDNNRVNVGDMVETTRNGIRYRGMVEMVTPRKRSPWIHDVLVKGISSGNIPIQKQFREDLVKPLDAHEPFIGETVFVLNGAVMHDHALCWYNDDSARVNGGKFCVVRGWYTNPKTRKRCAIVEHNDGKAKADPKFLILLNK